MLDIHPVEPEFRIRKKWAILANRPFDGCNAITSINTSVTRKIDAAIVGTTISLGTMTTASNAINNMAKISAAIEDNIPLDFLMGISNAAKISTIIDPAIIPLDVSMTALPVNEGLQFVNFAPDLQKAAQ